MFRHELRVRIDVSLLTKVNSIKGNLSWVQLIEKLLKQYVKENNK